MRRVEHGEDMNPTMRQPFLAGLHACALLLATLPMLACASTATPAPPGRDGDGGGAASPAAGSAADGAGAATTAWDLCTDLAEPSTEIAQEAAIAPFPAAAGGLLVEGAYELVAFDVLDAVRTSDRKALRVAFRGGRFEWRNGRTSTAGAYATHGETLSLRATCSCQAGAAGEMGSCTTGDLDRTFSFTANARQLMLLAPYVNGGTAAMTLRRE